MENKSIKINPEEILAKVGKFEIKGKGPLADNYEATFDGKFMTGIQQILIDLDTRGGEGQLHKPVTILLRVDADRFGFEEDK